jgi:glutaredoxin 3
MKEVVIYTTRGCAYCARAKRLLGTKGVPFEEIDVSFDAELREKMTELSGGRRTVPQIFADGAHIGDCDDLYALEALGQLDPLLGLKQ